MNNPEATEANKETAKRRRIDVTDLYAWSYEGYEVMSDSRGPIRA